mmetsp:Transcript_25860/g.57449  ORF Transcript_25860/g.57449 Transcript_25860/m.57449 type:complete len:281 (-) Transcript_25860:244-1086(-)
MNAIMPRENAQCEQNGGDDRVSSSQLLNEFRDIMKAGGNITNAAAKEAAVLAAARRRGRIAGKALDDAAGVSLQGKNTTTEEEESNGVFKGISWLGLSVGHDKVRQAPARRSSAKEGVAPSIMSYGSISSSLQNELSLNNAKDEKAINLSCMEVVRRGSLNSVGTSTCPSTIAGCSSSSAATSSAATSATTSAPQLFARRASMPSSVGYSIGKVSSLLSLASLDDEVDTEQSASSHLTNQAAGGTNSYRRRTSSVFAPAIDALQQLKEEEHESENEIEAS